MEILKLEQRLEGAIGGRGKFLGYKPKNANGEEKKDAKYEHQHMDWESHFSGKDYLGISPVKIIFDGSVRKGLCRWVAWDLDIEEVPEKFCRAVFRINRKSTRLNSSHLVISYAVFCLKKKK